VASSTAVTAVAIPAVLTIGDITVTEDRILTPNGTAPLKGSQWFVRDLSRTEEKIPTSAIVLAIIFSVFCLLGLLFLLQKEKRTTGYVEVEVRSGKLTHTTQIPVSSPYVVNQVRALVAQAQALAGQPPEEREQANRPEASDLTAKLNELADLRDRGVLTDEEFQAQKSKLLGDSY
jgi:hypothetical protein